MTQVLILRSEPAASATVRRARKLGLEASSVPLFKIEPIAWEVPDPAGFDGLLLTSANAIRCGGAGLARLRDLKAYAVGAASADVARKFGFAIAASGEDGVDRLLGSIEPGLRLLHLAGADRREPKGAEQEITTLIVYRAAKIDRPVLPQATGYVALVHSPRAAMRLWELITDRSDVTIAAISPNTADAAGKGWKAVCVADRPTDEAVLALAVRLCNKPDPK